MDEPNLETTTLDFPLFEENLEAEFYYKNQLLPVIDKLWSLKLLRNIVLIFLEENVLVLKRVLKSEVTR